MSRYYSIDITESGGAAFRQYTSLAPSGQSLPGALNVELDIPVVPFATPMGGALVRVWGISLQDIGQASDLNGKLITVSGGMQKGLPLANPKQSGVLVQGYVFQAFGNWIGTDMTLDLVIQAGAGPNGTGQPEAPRNIILNWKAGTSLSQALKTSLNTAFPGFTQTINISSKLVRGNDEVGYYASLTELCQYLKQVSKDIVGKDYAGVDLVLSQKAFTAYDGTAASGAPQPVQIAFQDLIGQPTWIEAPLIQFKCAMRADLKVSDAVKLPPTLVTNTQQAQSSLVNQRANFQGNFNITSLRHVGNFRQADAASWVTVMTAAPVPASG